MLKKDRLVTTSPFLDKVLMFIERATANALKKEEIVKIMFFSPTYIHVKSIAIIIIRGLCENEPIYF